MFSFQIDQEVWTKFPGMVLVCGVAAGLNNAEPNPEAATMLADAQDAVRRAFTPAAFSDLPHVTAWRQVQPGKDFPSAHEAIARRVVTGKPLRAINPLVDAYTATCLNFFAAGIAAPIGAWSVTEVPAMRLVETSGGESFTELGTTDPVNVAPGEIAYADETRCELVTRHFVWRQSNLGAIRPQTTAAFLVSELIAPYANASAQVERAMVDMVRRCFGVKLRTAVLAAPSLSWEVAA